MENKKQWTAPQVSDLTVDSTESGGLTGTENGESHS